MAGAYVNWQLPLFVTIFCSCISQQQIVNFTSESGANNSSLSPSSLLIFSTTISPNTTIINNNISRRVTLKPPVQPVIAQPAAADVNISIISKSDNSIIAIYDNLTILVMEIGNNNNESSSSFFTQIRATPRNTSIIASTTVHPLARPVFVKSAPVSGTNSGEQLPIRPKSAGNGDDQATTTANSGDITTTAVSGVTTAQKSTTTQPHFVVGPWTYEGINDWGKASDMCAQGAKQSPISLSPEFAYTARNFATDPMQFKNYDNKNLTGALTNNGHALVWLVDSSLPTKSLPTIGGTGYGSTTFVLDRFEFHWGGEDLDSGCKGSDHVVDYNPSPLEVQFTHRNVKYHSYEEAQLNSDGFASISFLFRVSLDEQIGNKTTINYSRIVDALENVVSPNSSIGLALDMTEMLPSFVLSKASTFYRYEGSQTSPPCLESVSWTVYQDRIAIPLRQLQAFRNKMEIKAPSWSNKQFQTMENNYRPIQMMNSRPIWTNGPGYASQATENTIDLMGTLFAISMVVALKSLIL